MIFSEDFDSKDKESIFPVVIEMDLEYGAADSDLETDNVFQDSLESFSSFVAGHTIASLFHETQLPWMVEIESDEMFIKFYVDEMIDGNCFVDSTYIRINFAAICMPVHEFIDKMEKVCSYNENTHEGMIEALVKKLSVVLESAVASFMFSYGGVVVNLDETNEGDTYRFPFWDVGNSMN